MKIFLPTESTLTYEYTRALGPRYMSAGITIFIKKSTERLHIEPNLIPDQEHYWEAAKRGLLEGIEATFPGEIFSGSIEIKSLKIHHSDSSELAFLLCARALVSSLPTLISANR